MSISPSNDNLEENKPIVGDIDGRSSVIHSERYVTVPGAEFLSGNGDSATRIGKDNKRTVNNFIAVAESILTEGCPLALTCDIRPIHPPFFREFCYSDLLGGVLLNTLSAEINYRIHSLAAELDTDKEFSLGTVSDKYEMQKLGNRRHKKVLFLPGANTTEFLSEDALSRFVMDTDWVVKLHPVSGEGMINDCITAFGADRVLNRHISGHELVEQADEVAVSAASELYLRAILLEKKVTNITNYARQHMLAYGTIVSVIDKYANAGADSKELKRRMNNMLMSDLSGFLLESNGTTRNEELAEKYYEKAMALREPHRLAIPQRLMVADVLPKNWSQTPSRGPKR